MRMLSSLEFRILTAYVTSGMTVGGRKFPILDGAYIIRRDFEKHNFKDLLDYYYKPFYCFNI